MGESKSGGTLNNINARSESTGEYASNRFNRLAPISEWHPEDPPWEVG